MINLPVNGGQMVEAIRIFSLLVKVQINSTLVQIHRKLNNDSKQSKFNSCAP